jgi:serine/threonine protein kinase
MITAPGAVKLIDFGIVRAAVQTHKTEIGVVKGKFSYMAPEMLVVGAEPEDIDHRADLFGLGIVLHETLTGRSLFRGKNDEHTLERVRSLPIPDVSKMRTDVPPLLSQLILRALERNPAKRFQSATELLAQLEHVAERCNIHVSVTKLRDEVHEYLGESPAASLDEEARAMLAEAPPPPAPPVYERLGSEPRARITEEAGFTGKEPSITLADAKLQGLERDPELIYYLRASGSIPQRRGTTGADAAFDLLDTAVRDY